MAYEKPRITTLSFGELEDAAMNAFLDSGPCPLPCCCQCQCQCQCQFQ